MSDAAESTPRGFLSGFLEGLRYPTFATFSVAQSVVDAVSASMPDVHDCRVCEEPVVAYEVCYDCEQGYYPPREYWQEVAA